MSERLGKIERLEAESFRKGKKVYLVTLVYCGEQAPDEYKEKCRNYWQQVETQLANLASKIGKVDRIYHESVFQAGEDGMRALEKLNAGSCRIAKTECDSGASLEAIEDEELFKEVMDWQRCLMLGFMSEKVESKVSAFYIEAARKRNEAMIGRIAETLQENEAGLLFVGEGHSLQFPVDIEVFSVVPPALDEIHRWLRDRASLQAQKVAEEAAEKPERRTRKAEKGTRTRARKKPKA